MTLISPQEAVAAQQRGAALLDIRPAGEFKAGRLPGSTNAEFFRLIAGEDNSFGLFRVLRAGGRGFRRGRRGA